MSSVASVSTALKGWVLKENMCGMRAVNERGKRIPNPVECECFIIWASLKDPKRLIWCVCVCVCVCECVWARYTGLGDGFSVSSESRGGMLQVQLTWLTRGR